MATLRGKVIVAAALAVLAVADVQAQGRPQLPPGVSLRDVRSRLRASGLTNEQIRQQLSQRGYDPGLLDAFLADTATVGEPAANVFDALRSLQVPALDSLLPAASPVPAPDTTAPSGPEIFGLRELARLGGAMAPVATGPVPGTYVVGPGDELVLVLTGDVEAAYALPVTRDGFFVVPRVGQVWANGIALERLRDQMFTHLGRVYSGVRRGTGATTRFELSLGRLRTNQVFVTGEVAQPGSYLLSPIASVMNGLSQAGGPRRSASLRHIQVVRGGRVVHRVDLYAFLLRGDNLDSVRLETGDVVFVPLRDDGVLVTGEVHRPAIYEVRPGETLFHVLRHAGGLSAPAALRRARISRLLPPAERLEAGVDRVVTDADLTATMADSTRAPLVGPGDQVHVFPVRAEVRNLVTVQGAVWHAGSYGFRPGMRASDLIRLGNGTTPRAYRRLAHISRLNLSDSSVSLIAFGLDTLADGSLREDPELREYDAVSIYDATAYRDRMPVNISGQVQSPLSMDYQDGMTLRDLIVRAGGLTPRADVQVEIARFASQEERERGSLAEIIRVRIDSSYIIPETAVQRYLGNRDSLSARLPHDAAAALPLRPYDQVLVRRVPFFALPRSVAVTGEVRSPGRYALETRGDRLVDLLLRRTGGLTPQAFPEGFQLHRNGRRVNVDLVTALRDPSDANNVALEENDSLVVPEFNAVVTVQGAVNSPATVLYRPGAGLDYYVANAGGYAANADARRTHVRFANGSARVRGRFLLFFGTSPSPGPGSTITVPTRDPEDRFDLRGFMADAVQIVTAVATIIIVSNR